MMSEIKDADVQRALSGSIADIASLRDRFAVEAVRDGAVDVSFRYVDSPVGDLLLACTHAGLLRVAFAAEGFDEVLVALAQVVSPRVVQAAAPLDDAAHALDAYFSGSSDRFGLPLDLRLVSGFRRSVIELLPSIAYGATASYADIAAAVGNPKAVRAVGSACGHNPLPIVVPCHRVVRSDGSMGQYLGGIEAKRLLLDLESPAG